MLKPLGDRVLIEPVEAEEKSAGGIYIPDKAQEKPPEGIVLSVGPGTDKISMTLKEGDRIMYGKYAGTELEHEGKKLLIMNEYDVLVVVS